MKARARMTPREREEEGAVSGGEAVRRGLTD